MNKVTILHRGEKFDSQGSSGLFLKDVASVGTWIHPVTKKLIEFDRSRLERLADNTNRYLRAENKVPFPNAHSEDVMESLGKWPGPFFAQGERLWGFVHPQDKTAQQKMRDGILDSVSACIAFDVMDSKGNKYDEVITHVCATDYPVVTGQKSFVELSSRPGWGDTHVGRKEFLETTAAQADTHSRRSEMDMSKLAAALGLPTDTAPEKLMEEAQKRIAGAGAAATNATNVLQQQVAAQLSTHGLELKDGKVVKLEKKDDDPEKKELRERLAKVELDGLKQKVESAKLKAASLVKGGQVPPALQQRLERILSISSNTEAIVLSADAKQIERVGIDLSNELSALFAELPAMSRGGLQQHGATSTEAQKESERLSKLGSDLAEKLQPKK